MKKLIFAALLLGAFTFQAKAQEISKNAIGIRLSSDDGFGAEVNYQRAILERNRLEFGVALADRKGYQAIKAVGMFQWVWNIEDNFNWYAGPGVGFGQYSFDDNRLYDGNDRETFAFVTGVAGIEYHFDFPLLLSFDIRPEIPFSKYTNDVFFNVGIAARYQF